jgi:hypothetical protein
MILRKLEDLFKPTEEIWKNLDYKNISQRNKINLIISNKKLITDFDDEIDNSILYALNYYDNLNAFTIFGKKKSDAYKYYLDNFKNDYILYGLKHMKINTSTLPKIFYQLFFPRMIIKNKHDLYDFLKEEYKFVLEYSEESIDVTILLVCKRDLNKKYPFNDIIEKDFCVYIPNTKEQIIHNASIFFCNSTIKFLDLQNLDYFLSKDYESSKKMFLKYRKWQNINIPIEYQSQYMLFSSVVLYLLGHRPMNDLDLYVHKIPRELEELTNELGKNDIFNFIDFKIKNTSNWPNYWDSWLDIWAQKCGAKYFEELLGNQKYHFYFLGIKIISLDCDVKRRLARNRPRAYADLIALRKRYHYKINIPPVPNKLEKYITISDKSEYEINNMIKEGGILNEKNNEILIKYDNDISKFIGTIIYALSTRYHMTFTENDIRKELCMRELITNKTNNEMLNTKKIKIVIKKK